MTVADDLRAARKLIEQPETWCKGASAVDAKGFTADARTAVRRCALGALTAVTVPSLVRFHAARDALYPVLPPRGASIQYFNDAPTTTHADILALFDRAIAAAEGRAE